MITKADFKAIAEMINNTTNKSVSIGVTYPKIDKRKLVFELADYFEQENTNFNRKQFMGACGL